MHDSQIHTTERVSVVIPCYNEERFIGKALENLTNQYDDKHYEIVIVDGMSADATREVISRFEETHPEITIRLVDNPERNIPKALNLGIAHAQGEIILRMDAHAVPSKGYVRRCVELVKGEAGSVIGAPCHVCPGSETLVARAIARAVSHPFGIGDAKYRLKDANVLQEPVDTVAFGAFKKELWHEVGGFNEELLTNEDYDFNYRVRALGGVVLLDRTEHCDYFARSTLSELARQYFRYGTWKARMLKLHPGSVRWRHFVAPAFIASILLFSLLGFLWTPAWYLLAAGLGSYVLLGLIAGHQQGRNVFEQLGLTLLMPLVFFTIHASWGTSFLLGLVSPSPRR